MRPYRRLGGHLKTGIEDRRVTGLNNGILVHSEDEVRLYTSLKAAA